MSQVSIRGLLQRADLRLQLIGTLSSAAAVGLDRPLRWGYSTDLLDPTPFLRGAELVLTTGQQLWGVPGSDAATRAYVDRLVAGGAGGLVYTVEHPLPAWETALRTACVDAGLPLVQAPFETPFVSISEVISAGRHDPEREAMRRIIHAQHALTLAALERRPASAIVRELSLTLGCSVWLWNAASELACKAGPTGAPQWAEEVARERLASAAPRRQVGVRLNQQGQEVVVYLLNSPIRRGEAVGVLMLSYPAVLRREHSANTARDRDDRTIVNNAVALLQLALAATATKNDGADRASQALRALLDDDVEVGRALLAQSMPPVVRDLDESSDWMLVLAEHPPSAERATAVLQLTEHAIWVSLVHLMHDDQRSAAARLSEIFGSKTGTTALVAVPMPQWREWRAPQFSLALSAGLARFQQGNLPLRPLVLDARAQLVRRALAADAGAARALAELAEQAHRADAASGGGALVATFVTWCEAMYSWQAAASHLGVHRNTVVRRITALGRGVGMDLAGDVAGARLLWLAVEQSA